MADVDATTSTACAFCPGTTAADGTLRVRSGALRAVCVECAGHVFAGDWQAFAAAVVAYELATATRWERLVYGYRARRHARRWATAVRTLTEPRGGPPWT